MSERYDQELILGYVEGELGEAERASFEATLAEDHELRNLVAQLKLDRENLRSLGGETAPVGLIDQVIQANERAELLGDPEAPEPLPLSLPVNRRRVRRVLAYSGIAAVLLISAAIVIPTLQPSALLENPGTLALDSSAETKDVPDTGAGIALLDEDAVYDTPDSWALSRMAAGEADLEDAKGEPAATLADAGEAGEDAARVEALEVAEAEAEAVDETPVFADADAKRETVDDAKPGEADEAPVLAMADEAGEPVPSAPSARAMTGMAAANATETPTRAESADAAVGTLALKESQAAKPQADVGDDEKVETALAEAGVDPFGGYADASTQEAGEIPKNTQLLINAPSPRQARRELRSWALTNSARVTRSVSEGSPNAPQGEPTLVIEVDQDKVPRLLAFLNAAPGQRAELLNPDGTVSPQNDTDSEAAEAEPSTATANRMVDTRTWSGDSGTGARSSSGGLVNGLSAGTGGQSGGQSRTDADRDESVRDKAETRRDEPGSAFNIDKLLESLRNRSDKPAPLLQAGPGENRRVTLQVIVKQVADETVEEGVSRDAEPED